MIRSGECRCIDDWGRIWIPKVVREAALGTSKACGKRMEFFYEEDGTIILKPVKDDNEF